MAEQYGIDFLMQYRHCINHINSISEEMIRIRSWAMKITPAISDAPVSKNKILSSKMEKAFEVLDELEEKMQAEIGKLQETMGAVNAAIDELEEEHLKDILRYKYINNMALEEIAERMNYSERHTIRLHKEAVNRVIECHPKQC